MRGEPILLEELIEHKVDLSVRTLKDVEGKRGVVAFGGRTALAMAADHDDVEMIDLLLAAGADVDGTVCDDELYTPLRCAALAGASKAVKALLAGGADKNSRCKAGYDHTPLHEAAKRSGKKHVEIVRLLLEAGAEPDAPLTIGTTPLAMAANSYPSEHVCETIALLLRYGADPRRGTDPRDGWSPLHWAVYWSGTTTGDAGVVELLLGAGADRTAVTTKDYRHLDGMIPAGSTPADVARTIGATELAGQLA